MKKNKKTFFSTITNFIFVLVLIGITIGTIYFIDAINKAPEINIKQVDKRISSKVYDEDTGPDEPAPERKLHRSQGRNRSFDP